MNSIIEAQRGLTAAVQEAHTAATLSGMRDIGIKVVDWADVERREDEIQTIVDAYNNSGDPDGYADHWHIGNVAYDTGVTEYYDVPLLCAKTIRLGESGAPMEYGYDNGFFSQVTFPSKFLTVRTYKAGVTECNSAVVLISPDMPAVVIPSEKIDHVFKSAHTDHTEIGIRIIPMVEKAFGKSVVHPLSEEACVALAAAVRSASKKLAHIKDSLV